MGNKYYCLFNEGSKINQILCALMIIWPVFSYGTGVGWVSPSTLLLQSERSPANRPLTDTEISWMASVSFITCIPSTLLFAYLADTIGRKRSLLFMSAMFVVCWLLKIYSADPWILVTARLVFGVAMGGAYVLCPPYLKEISEDSIRGALGSLVVVGQTGGNLVAYVLGDILEYQTLLYCCLALPVVHLLLFLSMPESPDYLIKKGRREDATKALAWLRCRDEQSPLVQNEVERIIAELGRERRDSVLKAIARDDTLRTAFGIALAVTLARELCGANPVLTFAGSVFSLAGAGVEGFGANKQAVALGAVQLLGAILASAAVEKAGRKSLLIISSMLSSAGMLVLAIWFGTAARITTSGWIPLTALCLCIFCDAAGLQPISVVLLNEIFSFRYRGSVSAVAMCIAAVIDFLQLLVFKPVCSKLGAQYPFIVFSAICLFIAVYVWRYVPETKARALDDIYNELQNRKTKVPKKNKEQDAAVTRKLVAESMP